MGAAGFWYMGATQPQQHVGSVYEQYLAQEKQLAESSSATSMAQYNTSFRCPALWSGTEWEAAGFWALRGSGSLDFCPPTCAQNSMDCDSGEVRKYLDLEVPPRGC